MLIGREIPGSAGQARRVVGLPPALWTCANVPSPAYEASSRKRLISRQDRCAPARELRLGVRLQSGPFDRPATAKPTALPEDRSLGIGHVARGLDCRISCSAGFVPAGLESYAPPVTSLPHTTFCSTFCSPYPWCTALPSGLSRSGQRPLSHFLLDGIVHVKGLPLEGVEGPALGLWRNLPLELAIEATMSAGPPKAGLAADKLTGQATASAKPQAPAPSIRSLHESCNSSSSAGDCSFASRSVATGSHLTIFRSRTQIE